MSTRTHRYRSTITNGQNTTGMKAWAALDYLVVNCCLVMSVFHFPTQKKHLKMRILSERHKTLNRKWWRCYVPSALCLSISWGQYLNLLNPTSKLLLTLTNMFGPNFFIIFHYSHVFFESYYFSSVHAICSLVNGKNYFEFFNSLPSYANSKHVSEQNQRKKISKIQLIACKNNDPFLDRSVHFDLDSAAEALSNMAKVSIRCKMKYIRCMWTEQWSTSMGLKYFRERSNMLNTKEN